MMVLVMEVDGPVEDDLIEDGQPELEEPEPEENDSKNYKNFNYDNAVMSAFNKAREEDAAARKK